MTAALIITLRETLEAALVVGIILAYLEKSGNLKHKKHIWYAVLAGVLVSVIAAFVLKAIGQEFEGTAEQIYEGVTMLLASGLLTWMILWMLTKRKNLKSNIENKVAAHIQDNHPMGLFFLTFVSVIREGIETSIFMQAASFENQGQNLLLGGILGIVLAIILSYILFKGIKKIQLKKFFTVTSVLLILFAAGLLAHGIHEFQEAGVIPIITEHIWDTNGFIDEKGGFGGILSGLFGYNGNPSLIETISYFAYLIVIALTWRAIEKKQI